MKLVGILTVSDRCSRGEAEDTSGQALADYMSLKDGFQVSKRLCVPDEKDVIADTLTKWVGMGLNVVLTTGGTGFSPRDVTPEATAAVIDRPAPGIVHQMFAKSLAVTPMAMLSRFSAGIKDNTLIINFPGSKKASVECLDFVFPCLAHGTDLIANDLNPVESFHKSHQASGSTPVPTSGHICPHHNTETKVDASNVAGRGRQSPFPLITVDEAQRMVLNHCSVLGTEQVSFTDALGRVLAEDVFANDALPPFPASIKDGSELRTVLK